MALPSFWKTTENIKRIGKAQNTSGIPTDTPSTNFGYEIRFDAVTNTLYCFNGTSWVSVVLS